MRHETKLLFEQGLKRCFGCKEIKPFAEFWKNNRWANGYSPRCKVCRSRAYQEWKEKNQEHLKLHNKAYRKTERVISLRTDSRRKRYAASPRNVMQITLAHGIHRFPTDSPATIDDLMAKFEAQEGRCAVTGIVMTWAKGKVLPTSISLDRIDPKQGYSNANLRLVCHAVNAFKGQMTDEQMVAMARAIVDKADAESREPHWKPYLVHACA